MAINSYRELEAWQLGMSFVEAVYELTRYLPREELYGLTSQLRRSAIGIPSNISEGHQQSTQTYRRYLTIALGCQAECETQLELIRRLKLASDEETRPVSELAARVGQVVRGLRRSLKRT
jgi:four helix bundle protein